MESVKTAIIVLLLLAVLYGVYVVLNKPEAPAPPDALGGADLASEPVIDFPDALTPPAGPPSQLQSPAPGAAGALSPPSSTPPVAPTSPPAGFAGPPVSPEIPSSAETSAATSPSGTESAAGTREPAPTPAESPSTKAESPPSGLATHEDYPSTPLSNAERRPEPSAGSESMASTNTATAGPWEPLTGSSPEPASDTSAETPATPEARTDAPLGQPNGLQQALQSARAKMAEGQWYEALFMLSLEYGSSMATSAERQQLLEILDSLAGRVIYSTEHLIEPPYEVRRGERLEDIAQRYNVPWQLLANINGIDNPDLLQAGTTIKVVPGPFRAEVDLTGKELTLFVNRLYAGRFPISVGADPAPPPGEYRVNDKQPGKAYYSSDGRNIPADDPGNPYGEIWIDLGGDVCIHGSSRSDGDGRMGCISLSPMDARDVYGILSKGSGVTVRR